MGGSRYDVFAGEEQIGMLWHKFKRVAPPYDLARRRAGRGGGRDRPRALARRCAILRRVIDFVPDVGGWIPIPYNFEFLAGDRVIGAMDRKFKLRDQYVLDLSGDTDRTIDRRLAVALAIALDALQNR